MRNASGRKEMMEHLLSFSNDGIGNRKLEEVKK